MNDLLSRLLAHERIRAARHHIERTDEVTLARQAALSAIPAPTGAEGRRAAHLAELFREIGLSDVSIDHAGNVHGWLGKNGRREAGEVGGPVVLAAHLDTVFGAEVDVAVERRGQRLEGPGISDNARGLAARSEEHTSELQSRLHLVCRLLLEKKKKKIGIRYQ